MVWSWVIGCPPSRQYRHHAIIWSHPSRRVASMPKLRDPATNSAGSGLARRNGSASQLVRGSPSSISHTLGGKFLGGSSAAKVCCRSSAAIGVYWAWPGLATGGAAWMGEGIGIGAGRAMARASELGVRICGCEAGMARTRVPAVRTCCCEAGMARTRVPAVRTPFGGIGRWSSGLAGGSRSDLGRCWRSSEKLSDRRSFLFGVFARALRSSSFPGVFGLSLLGILALSLSGVLDLSRYWESRRFARSEGSGVLPRSARAGVLDEEATTFEASFWVGFGAGFDEAESATFFLMGSLPNGVDPTAFFLGFAFLRGGVLSKSVSSDSTIMLSTGSGPGPGTVGIRSGRVTAAGFFTN